MIEESMGCVESRVVALSGHTSNSRPGRGERKDGATSYLLVGKDKTTFLTFIQVQDIRIANERPVDWI